MKNRKDFVGNDKVQKFIIFRAELEKQCHEEAMPLFLLPSLRSSYFFVAGFVARRRSNLEKLNK